MLNKNAQKNTGFTLLELLIYVTILSILVVVISNTFITLSRGAGQSQARGDVDSAVRFSAELLKQDIKNASTISTPSLGSSSSTLTLIRDGVTIVYDTFGGALRRKLGVASPDNVTNANIAVGTPSFTRIENTNSALSTTNVEIKINITFSYNGATPDYQYSSSLQTTYGQY